MVVQEHSRKYDNTFASYWKEKSPLIFRIRGSVLSKIWPQVALGVIYSIFVVCIHNYVVEVPQFPPSFITILGLVIGLLLVFRTSTGYDRYWEGRKLWSTLTWRLRMMAYSIYLAVKDGPNCTPTENFIEKRTAINLLIAFAYATKNYLREEYSHDADTDLEELVSHLSRVTSQSDELGMEEIRKRESGGVNNKQDQGEGKVGGFGKRTVQLTLSEDIPNKGKKKRNRFKERISMSMRRRSVAEKTGSAKTRSDSEVHAHDYVTPKNIPLELICHFISYLYKVIEEKRINGETGMVTLIAANDLTNCLTNLERILRTPIPMAYSIHLHQCIWLYILFLPLQFVQTVGWLTVAGMGLACTALLGILAIGWEIENPFGYDDNDLPLDDFCDVVREEIERLIRRPFPDSSNWIFSHDNRPFEPDCSLSVDDLRNLPCDDLQNVLMGYPCVGNVSDSDVSLPNTKSKSEEFDRCDKNEAHINIGLELEGTFENEIKN